MSLTVYLNGQFLPYEQAVIPVEDRAFLLADGIYEVIRVYGGRPFALTEHLQRLSRSAREIRLPEPDEAELERVSTGLIRANQLSDATIYIQVSRGAYTPRTHGFPVGPVKLTALVIARPAPPTAELRARGVAAITVPDTRWSRCDIKSVALLPNVLAKQAANDAGAFEAIFLRDGFAIEGSSSNFFAVLDGEIRTYPKCNYILGGVTRQVVIELAGMLGHTVREEGIPVEALRRCAELWISGTNSEITPIVALDGRTVGDGRPGPITAALQEAYTRRCQGA